MKNWRIGLFGALVIASGAAIYFFVWTRGNTPSYEGTELSGEAPDFQLTDQSGLPISLSDFRGHVVVLTFMDSKCTDTCPLTAAHFREAYRKLGEKEAKRVVFLGVNVNVDESDVSDVAEATRSWLLDEIPSWHFLTADQEVLGSVWNDYGVTAVHGHDGNPVMHTPGTFLIDPLGQQRWYISTFLPEEADTVLALPLSDLLLKHIREILDEN